MECDYNKLPTENEAKGAWTPLWRQLFVVYSVWIVYFITGLTFGIPTVMIPQIRREANSTEAVRSEMASWLYSVFGYGALPWVVILCVLTQYIGRKKLFLFVNINIFAYLNLLYFSTTLNQVLIAEIMQGVSHASLTTLCVIIVTEYVSPEYRGIFSTLKSANSVWGLWVSNAIGTFYPWRYIPLLGIILVLFNVTIVFWPESPQWLASRGRFDQCKKDHRWLRGTYMESEKQLEHLIKSQTQAKHTRITKGGMANRIRSVLNTLSRKEYYVPLLLSFLLLSQYLFLGKLVCMMYAIEIIKKITNSEAAAYKGMLLADAVTVIGLFAGCILSKFLNRRTLYFSSVFTSIALLFIISAYLFLIELGILLEITILTLALLVLLSVAISCGSLILSTAIAGELTPLRYKSSITMLGSLEFSCVASTLLKVFPYVSAYVHMSGAFLIFAIISTIISIITYKYLPETKDKGLQEIEEMITGRRIVIEGEELMPITNRNNI